MTEYKKIYIVPTINCLPPIKLLIEEYNLQNTKNMIYNYDIINDEINKEKIIIKIITTDCLVNFTEYLYRKIKNSPHIVNIYCFLHYNKSTSFFNDEYRNILGFNNDILSLEVIKKYDSSLNKYTGKLRLTTMIRYLRYILLIQIELFQKYGFIHNNLHTGNILLLNKKSTCQFIYNNKNINFTADKTLVFTDIENSIILSDDTRIVIQNSDKCKYVYTLESNILCTFNHMFSLLKNNKITIDKEINNEYFSEKESMNLLTAFCSGLINFNEYRKRILKICNIMISYLFRIFFKRNFI